MPDKEPTLVRIEHENYIPVPTHRLVKKLEERLTDSERPAFQKFCRQLEAIYHFEYHDLAREITQSYELFDPIQCNRKGEQAWEENIDYNAEEDRFLKAFARLMTKANFTPLNQDDIDLAEEEDYLFTLPVEIDWEMHDTEMLGRFLQHHPDFFDGEKPPKYAEKILIFRRGTGVDTTTQFFLIDKIDQIISNGVLKIFAWMKGLFKKKEGENATVGDAVSESPAASDAVEAAADQTVTEQALPEQTESEEKTSDETTQERTTIFEDRYVERKSLTNTKWKLWQRTTLQEPTFEQLVVLFRFATPEPKKKSETLPVRDRSIHLKMFRDIPMADLEVVFPEKKLSMQPKDLVSLIITGMIGLTITAYKLLFAAAVSPVIAIAALFGMGGYIFKILFGYKQSKNRYQSLVTSTLYDKSLDNASGVIFSLMESMKDQEFKEAILAYFFLWKEGPQSATELDARCEEFLQQDFDLEIDFEVPDALGKLKTEQLLTETGDRSEVPALHEALTILDHKWDSYFGEVPV